jgi:hypothetical protein
MFDRDDAEVEEAQDRRPRLRHRRRGGHHDAGEGDADADTST